MNWSVFKLNEVCDLNRNNIDKNFQFDRIVYHDISSVSSGSIIKNDEIELIKAPSRAKRIVKSNDTIISTVRPGNRSFYFFKRSLPNTIVSTGFAVLTPKKDFINPRFLYYLITTNEFTHYLLGYEQGSNYPAVTPNVIGNRIVSLPPLPIQRKIASILSAYDDLIENNSRRIKLLESMAKMIYDEWFVKFRFPGHESVKMVYNEELKQDIPEGWEVKKLNEISKNFDSKRIPLSKLKRDRIKGPYPYYGAAKVLDFIDNYIFEGKFLLLAEDGSVITTEGKPVLQLINRRFWANNHTHVLQGKGNVSTEFLYLKFLDYDISGHITGAAQPKINQENLNRISFIVAEDNVMNRFNSVAVPYFDLIDNLECKIDKLSKTRDLLLPKLISGEVDVSELDIKIREDIE